MRSQLNRYRDLKLMVIRARFSPRHLARACRISLRQLERYILARYQRPLYIWIREVRFGHAVTLLNRGKPLKEVSYRLHFRHYPSFASEFKRFCGVSPSQFMEISVIEKAEERPEKTTLFSSLSLKNNGEKMASRKRTRSRF